MNTLESPKESTFDHQLIIDKITRIHRDKQINEGDIIDWVSECETDYLQDVENMIGYAGIELTVKNYKALLPCNIYRILKVYTSRYDKNSDVPFNRSGRWLYFNTDMKKDKVYIDFYGIRIDENGYPVVMEGHVPALVAFCVHNLYYEDWIQNKLDNSKWMFIYEDMVNKVRDTRNSLRNVTIEELNKLHFIQFNMVPKIGTMNFVIDQPNSKF